MSTYPNCPISTRTIEIGGLTKSQLIQKIQQHSILMNDYGMKLLTDDRFITSNTMYNLKTIELAVKNLGFPKGATLPEIFKRSKELGLDLCPLEAGPYIRLDYQEQSEGNMGNATQQQAPIGSITIASEIVSEDDYFPKGFYIRKINGELWLRGYIADDLHVWNPDDKFIFCLK